jgi:hypothetical protein
MPSIFVWKSNRPLPTSTITYYEGEDWFLEDHGAQTHSVCIEQQCTLSGAIAYDTHIMPRDWVGSYLLEQTILPYALLKEDHYGQLEQLGDWLRFTLRKEIVFKKDVLEREHQKILTWITAEKEEPCLIRYDLPALNHTGKRPARVC